jgi:RND family efflux transporter MFP subunit
MAEKSDSTSAVRRLIVSELLILLFIGISIIIASLLYADRPGVQARPTEEVLLNVDVFRATPLNFQELLTGFGTARADREVTLAAQVTGEIIDIDPQLKVGYAVTAGQHITSPDSPSVRRNADLLLKIDPRDYQQRVDQTAARISETQTEIEQLKVQLGNVTRQFDKGRMVLATLKEEYQRVEEGVKRNAASASDLNRALLEVQRYEDAVIQLENQMASIPHQQMAAEQRLLTNQSENSRAESDLKRTEVLPPFDGSISEVFVEKGQYVRAGEPLVRLTDVSKVEIPVSLSFDDFLQLSDVIAAGDRPHAALSEHETAESRWTGRVVRSSPEADSQSRTVQVFVEVENREESHRLLPGAFVHSRIEGQTHKGVILIPREAIIDGAVYVVKEDGVVERRIVSLGRRLQSLVIVKEGLNTNDRVILTNLDIVEDGRRVIVQSVLNAQSEISSLKNPIIRLSSDSP